MIEVTIYMDLTHLPVVVGAKIEAPILHRVHGAENGNYEAIKTVIENVLWSALALFVFTTSVDA